MLGIEALSFSWPGFLVRMPVYIARTCVPTITNEVMKILGHWSKDTLSEWFKNNATHSKIKKKFRNHDNEYTYFTVIFRTH